MKIVSCLISLVKPPDESWWDLLSIDESSLTLLSLAGPDYTLLSIALLKRLTFKRSKIESSNWSQKWSKIGCPFWLSFYLSHFQRPRAYFSASFWVFIQWAIFEKFSNFKDSSVFWGFWAYLRIFMRHGYFFCLLEVFFRIFDHF